MAQTKKAAPARQTKKAAPAKKAPAKTAKSTKSTKKAKAGLTVGATANAAPNYHGQLQVSTVDSITMDRGWTKICILTDGSARVDYTMDGSTPVVGGSVAGRQIPASGGPMVDEVAFVGGAQKPTFKLISAGTPTYSIIGEY